MPTLSNYWFKNTDFRGETTFLSIQHGAGSWAWINWSNIGERRSTLTWERETRETTYDLVNIANDPLVLSLIDAQLGDADRTSPIRMGWVPRKYLPYSSSGNPLDLFLRLSFNIHISTPWYCTDANGHIDYIVACFLDGSGRFHANVHGWAYSYSGGGPFCTGDINDKLNSGIPAAVGILQEQLKTLLGLLDDKRFDLLYYLPGAAEKSGTGTTNVDTHVSLALLPR